MTLKELYTLEVEGISETIQEYAVDSYILSYSKQLLTLSIPDDLNMIKTIISRLTEWYHLQIKSIRDSHFVINKQAHEKTMRLLVELQGRLNK